MVGSIYFGGGSGSVKDLSCNQNHSMLSDVPKTAA